MTDRLLREAEVTALVALSRSTVWNMVRANRFPQPVRAGPRATRWRASDVETWIESLPTATGEHPPPAA